MNTLRFARLASGLLALGAALDLSAQAVLDNVFYDNGTYTQNFDSLAFLTGNNQAALTLPGWSTSDTNGYFSKTGTDGSAVGNGLSVFRPSAGSTDLALGSWTSSGSVIYGVQLQNNTGHVLDSVTISFAVENYLIKSATAPDPTYVSYGFNNGGLNLGSWNSLGLGSVDRSMTSFSTTLDLTWNSGESLWIRWEDFAVTGADAQLAIDNFSVAAIPEPSTYALILGVATLGLVGFRRWRAQR